MTTRNYSTEYEYCTNAASITAMHQPQTAHSVMLINNRCRSLGNVTFTASALISIQYVVHGPCVLQRFFLRLTLHCCPPITGAYKMSGEWAVWGYYVLHAVAQGEIEARIRSFKNLFPLLPQVLRPLPKIESLSLRCYSFSSSPSSDRAFVRAWACFAPLRHFRHETLGPPQQQQSLLTHSNKCTVYEGDRRASSF